MLRLIGIMVALACVAWFLASYFKDEPHKVNITGPVVHEPMTPIRQHIDLLDPPAGFEPPVWKPGDPIIDPGDIKFSKTISVARESWFRRWLRRLCCAIFSCQPEPPKPPDENPDPTSVKKVVDIDGIPGTGVQVPDPVGDIGPGHYVQAVNSAFQVFDTTGAALTNPLLINVLWAEKNSPCKDELLKDPIVRYDQAADRWLISGFIWENTTEDYVCIAVSKTPDPASPDWFLYKLKGEEPSTSTLFSIDSPKLSVWPDAYYLSTVQSTTLGLDVWALERSKMLQGLDAGVIHFHISQPGIALLPGDLDGPPPPAGSPGWFARQVDGERFDGESDRVEVFAFSVDWAVPDNSTFDMVASLTVDPFDSVICSNDSFDFCVPQPDTNQPLETLGAWPQWRLQYRNMSEHESLLFNHTIDADGNGHAGIRWYELRRPLTGNWAVSQQGTHYNPDLHYFMGGISMDQKGNIALGYAASSGDVYPSIRIAHRMAGDEPGTMPGTEYLAVAGSGSQIPPNGRWGNYSTMDVDPVDDCTFWYTHEYYKVTSQAGWLTRILSFRLPDCEQPVSGQY